MNKLIIGIIFSSVVLLVGGIVLIGSQNNSKSGITPLKYSASDKGKPIVKTDNILFDIGKMKVSEQKQKDFTINNIGSKTLQLSNISSSCGCTVAKVIYNGRESKEFGMHSKSDEIFEIAPKSEAKIRVIYRPFVMPVYGQVEREVYISTNDPDNPNLTFSIKAYVE